MSETDSLNPHHEIQPVHSRRASLSFFEKLAAKYDQHERIRIERIKTEIRENPMVGAKCEIEQIGVPPSLTCKIRRVVLDAIGIRLQKSETRREREAMSVALREYRTEQADQRNSCAN